MRILVTGFGAFGSVTDNPTARIVERLADEGMEGAELVAAVLPVSFERAQEEVERLIAEGGFDVALLMGVAAGESVFQLETRGRNCDSARLADVDGWMPGGGPIRALAPELYESPAPLEAIRAALYEAGFSARVSGDAGGYVCNRTYFAALHTIAERGLRTHALFLHVPSCELSGYSASQMTAAARTVLQELRNYSRLAAAPPEGRSDGLTA